MYYSYEMLLFLIQSKEDIYREVLRNVDGEKITTSKTTVVNGVSRSTFVIQEDGSYNRK